MNVKELINYDIAKVKISFLLRFDADIANTRKIREVQNYLKNCKSKFTTILIEDKIHIQVTAMSGMYYNGLIDLMKSLEVNYVHDEELDCIVGIHDFKVETGDISTKEFNYMRGVGSILLADETGALLEMSSNVNYY